VQTENIRIAYIDEIPPGKSTVTFKLNVVSCCRVPQRGMWRQAARWQAAAPRPTAVVKPCSMHARKLRASLKWVLLLCA
jgi:hypothetical protein